MIRHGNFEDVTLALTPMAVGETDDLPPRVTCGHAANNGDAIVLAGTRVYRSAADVLDFAAQLTRAAQWMLLQERTKGSRDDRAVRRFVEAADAIVEFDPPPVQMHRHYAAARDALPRDVRS